MVKSETGGGATAGASGLVLKAGIDYIVITIDL